MRVLIPQQYHSGHFYQYIAFLLPALSAVADEVVVAVTPEGRASDEFAALLAGFAGAVRFPEILPPASPWLPMSERWRVHRDVRRVVSLVAPDYVLIPSGDAPAAPASLFRMAGLGALPGRVPCEVGIHFGSGLGNGRSLAGLRDSLNQLNLTLGGFARVHLVNFLFYEGISRGAFRSRFSLMPHPVAPNPRLSRAASRRKLGIPVDGRYIGLAASLDSRKAIAEFLAAFRAASHTANERLLLAGWISDSHLRTIRESYQDLIDEGRLVLMQGFVSPETYQTVLTALDVVCTPYPGFGGLSSTLLEGVAAGRPILANAYGWSQAIIRRFGVGSTCDVLNHPAFTTAIRSALDRCDQHEETEPIKRLLTFHLPENYAQSWLAGIRAMRGLDAYTARSWSWVLEAVAPNSRTLT